MPPLRLALLPHAPGELFGLLAKLGLLAGQLLQLPLHLFGVQPGLGELALPAAQVFLAPGEVANAIEGAVARLTLVGAGLDRGLRLVVGALLTLQLLVEERREILP